MAAWLALAGQGMVAFESAFHRHNDTATGHKDGCTVCAAITQRGQPVDPPPPIEAPAPTGFAEDLGRELPAILPPLTSLTSRGPPSTPAV